MGKEDRLRASMSKGVLIAKLEEAISREFCFSSDDPIISYVEYVLSIPVMRPRRIEKARDFSCPEENVKGLEILESAILHGSDLLPWMSKKYSKDKFYGNDHLMHLYAVSHFHLGEDVGKTERVRRTKNLLYALVADDVVYELDVRAHGAWSIREWQEKLISNWPEAFQQYILPPQYKLLSREPQTDEQLSQLTAAGISTFVQTSFGLSLPIGGGVTGAGTSSDAVHIAIKIMNALSAYEMDYVKCFGYKNLNAAMVEIDRDWICYHLPHVLGFSYRIPGNR